MAVINKNDSFSVNINRSYLYIILSEKKLESMQDYFSNNPTNSDKSFYTEFCLTYKKINTINNTIKELEILNNNINDILIYVINYNINNITEIIIKHAQLICLKIKQFILNLKRLVNITIKKSFLEIIEHKGSESDTKINEEISILTETYKIMSKTIYYIMLGVKATLDIIPSTMGIEAESMLFFMTLKSLKNISIDCLNPNKSICDRLPAVTKTAINAIEETVNKLNNSKRAGIIVTAAIAGAATANTGFHIDNNICESLQINKPIDIIKGTDEILSLLPLPEAMPKYEKLSLLNIGFLAWLMTGFCPAGKNAFGIPGYP